MHGMRQTKGMSKPTLIRALAHVCLRSSDLQATERFYCEALGMTIQFRFTKHGRVMGFYIQVTEGQFIEVFENEKPEPPTANAVLAHFCLETPDIHGLHARLTEFGYGPSEVKEGCDKALQFWVTDPNGLRFEFHQYGPESLQFQGGTVEVPW